jgi:hypothetical protein
VVYERVLREAASTDEVSRYVNGRALVEVWSRLWLPQRVRRLWEDRFPELTAQALAGVDRFPDQEYGRYGLTAVQIQAIREEMRDWSRELQSEVGRGSHARPAHPGIEAGPPNPPYQGPRRSPPRQDPGHEQPSPDGPSLGL